MKKRVDQLSRCDIWRCETEETEPVIRRKNKYIDGIALYKNKKGLGKVILGTSVADYLGLTSDVYCFRYKDFWGLSKDMIGEDTNHFRLAGHGSHKAICRTPLMYEIAKIYDVIVDEPGTYMLTEAVHEVMDDHKVVIIKGD